MLVGSNVTSWTVFPIAAVAVFVLYPCSHPWYELYKKTGLQNLIYHRDVLVVFTL